MNIHDGERIAREFAAKIKPGDEDRVKREFHSAVGAASKGGGSADLLGNARRLFLKLISGELSGWSYALVVGALLYFVSPIDIIPDWIPIIGWLDDAAVLAAVAKMLERELD